MITVGLTSVTFNKLSAEEIVEYCKKSGVDTIEWGSEVHLPEGDEEKAKSVKALCDKEGIKISSYGSYYRCGTYENPEEEFAKYLTVAKIIGAPKIRIWVGTKEYKDASEEYYNSIIAELKMMCEMAKKENIHIGCEFHEGTLTGKRESSLKVIKDVGYDNFGMYFQHDFFESDEENYQTLRDFIPTLKNVHVYNVTTEYKRYSLAEGNSPKLWANFAEILKENNISANFLLEFLPNPCLEELTRETEILKNIVNR